MSLALLVKFEMVGLNQITQVLNEVALLVMKRRGLPSTPALSAKIRHSVPSFEATATLTCLDRSMERWFLSCMCIGACENRGSWSSSSSKSLLELLQFDY